MKLKSNIDLGKSFEMLKGQLAMSRNDINISNTIVGKLLPTNPLIDGALNRLITAIETHLAECTEPRNTLAADPDDLKDTILFTKPDSYNALNSEL